MIDEFESGGKFFGNTLKSIDGEIKAPDSFRMLVDVVAPGFGFVQIEMMAVGDQAFMKFAKDAPWAPMPLDQVPFNFGGIGATLSDLVPVIQDLSISGKETVEGVRDDPLRRRCDFRGPVDPHHISGPGLRRRIEFLGK